MSSIRRHRDGTGGSPTVRMIGIYEDALKIPDEEIKLLTDPDHTGLPGIPSFLAMNEKWEELIENLQRRSQLPDRI